jgi:hypothetical protein
MDKPFSQSLSKEIDVEPEVHYLSAPKDVRKMRVEKRNAEKDPSAYSFEVTAFPPHCGSKSARFPSVMSN